jgi:hypothetical protein
MILCPSLIVALCHSPKTVVDEDIEKNKYQIVQGNKPISLTFLQEYKNGKCF